MILIRKRPGRGKPNRRKVKTVMVKILMKVTGIGILTEITVLLCADSGNSSLGQSLRTLSTGVILWLALPIFQAMLDLVQSILEGL